MTIAPVKNRLENIINLPNNMPVKMIRTLMQDVMERSWEDVENLQKEAWKIPDSQNRNIVDQEVERSYRLRYGDAPAKQDATGRIINQEKEWNPIKGTDSDKMVKIGLKLRSLSRMETNENIFRGVENGLNILRSADDKAVKVEGNFGEPVQNLFDKVLRTKSMPEILKALKTGLITDCVMSYQNRDLGADVKKNKVAQILNVFNQDEEELDVEQEGEFDDEGQETQRVFGNDNKKIPVSLSKSLLINGTFCQKTSKALFGDQKTALEIVDSIMVSSLPLKTFRPLIPTAVAPWKWFLGMGLRK